MQINRGMRCKLGDLIDLSMPLIVKMETKGSSTYDTCCFGIDSDGKISDDRYTIFYNQTASPENAIKFLKSNNTDDYLICINSIPSSISKLVFTVSIDGNGTMGEISSHSVKILQNNCTLVEMILTGDDFNNEKAIIGVEIYKKNEWRIAAIARGFDGGLDALVKHYGGEISEEQNGTSKMSADTSPIVNTAPQTDISSPEPISTSAPDNSEDLLAQKIMKKISLSKDRINLEKHVVNLSKTVISLEKKSGVDLGSLAAKVVVALDYSGSMSRLYSNGTVQRTLNKLVPLGLTFDDNGSIDIYLFQNDYRKFQDMSLSNYENYVKNIINRSGYSMGGTNYAPVLNAIVYGGYRPSGFLGLGHEKIEAIVDNSCPTFVLFITDGENADKAATDSVLRKISSENLFVQFIGIGNERFSYLQKIDNLSGRTRDNTGFTKMSDLDNAVDTELYNAILEEFSRWVKNMQ